MPLSGRARVEETGGRAWSTRLRQGTAHGDRGELAAADRVFSDLLDAVRASDVADREVWLARALWSRAYWRNQDGRYEAALADYRGVSDGLSHSTDAQVVEAVAATRREAERLERVVAAPSGPNLWRLWRSIPAGMADPRRRRLAGRVRASEGWRAHGERVTRVTGRSPRIRSLSVADLGPSRTAGSFLIVGRRLVLDADRARTVLACGRETPGRRCCCTR